MRVQYWCPLAIKSLYSCSWVCVHVGGVKSQQFSGCWTPTRVCGVTPPFYSLESDRKKQPSQLECHCLHPLISLSLVLKFVFVPISLWSLFLGNDWESVISGKNGSAEIFVKSSQRGTSHRYEIRTASISTYFSKSRDISYDGSTTWPECPGKLGKVSPVGYMQRNIVQRLTKDHVTKLHLRPCLVPIVVCSQRNHKRLLEIVRYFEFFEGCCPSSPLHKKRGCAMHKRWARALVKMFIKHKKKFLTA